MFFVHEVILMLGSLYTNGKINALVSETILDWHEPFYCEQEYTF